jgi:hypothetical protein
MTVIKRCEKDVPGTWIDKQEQAKAWMDHFVPHYAGRCVPNGGCPAKHGSPNDDSKKWLDDEHPVDDEKIDELLQLIERMKADVSMYIHGYHTCAVECAHSERTVHTSKRIEYWTNWEGKCRLVQLLHNHRTRTTGESLLQQLGWQVMEGVSTHLSRIDRDKAKHHQIKTAPSYNSRQKAIQRENKSRKETDNDLIAREEERRQKNREKQRHYYSVRKQLLYEAAEEKKEEGGVVGKKMVVDVGQVKKKRGRPRKKQAVEKGAAEKENDSPARSSSPSEMTKRRKVDTLSTAADTERPALKAMVMNRAVGVRLVLHPAMQELVMMTGCESCLGLVSGAKSEC